MSQSGARSQGRGSSRQASNAIEKLPDLGELLGIQEKAEDDKNRILMMARNLRSLDRVQLLEGLKDTDAIPNTAPEADGKVTVDGQTYRSFKQQRDLINEAYARLWEQIEEEGHRPDVEVKLREARESSA